MSATSYIILAQLGIALLYILYKLFLSHDTFLRAQRYTLLGMVFFAYLYPLVNIDVLSNHALVVQDRMVQQGVGLPAIAIEADYASASITLIDLYYIGVVVGLSLLAIRVLSVLFVRKQCVRRHIDGIDVYCSHRDIEPFSFGSNIFMNPHKYDAPTRSDILLHEMAHVKGMHTFDLLLGEIVVVLGWFNPFAWLLRYEMQLVVEYLADAVAVKRAHSAKDYQYHLLQVLQNRDDVSSLGTHFNHKMLFQRVKKINQSRSHYARGVAYVILLPAILLLLFVSNAFSMPQQEHPIENAMPQEVEATDDTLPHFPGGEKALMKFLSENVKYPEQASRDSVQGKVIVRFVVDTEGCVVSPTILRSLSPECDAEVLRVVGLMPRWLPCTQNGAAVEADFVLPVNFVYR